MSHKPGNQVIVFVSNIGDEHVPTKDGVTYHIYDASALCMAAMATATA